MSGRRVSGPESGWRGRLRAVGWRLMVSAGGESRVSGRGFVGRDGFGAVDGSVLEGELQVLAGTLAAAAAAGLGAGGACQLEQVSTN